MKRIIKLCSTVVLLMLSAAVLCVGVYAATRHTYTVTNNISYSIGDNIEVGLELAKCYTTTSTPSAITAVTWSQEGDEITNLLPNGATWTTDVADDEQTKSWNPGAFNLAIGGATAVVYQFEFKNIAPVGANSFSIKIKLSAAKSSSSSFNFAASDTSAGISTADRTELTTSNQNIVASLAPQSKCFVQLEYNITNRNAAFNNTCNPIFSFAEV